MAKVKLYDPEIIITFAYRLYSRADSLVVSWALRMGVLGVIAGAAVGFQVKSLGIIPALVLGLIGGLLGASYGREKGFELRLTAQQALCQLQTEINTRGESPSVAPAVVAAPIAS